jgi:hypothetical protein
VEALSGRELEFQYDKGSAKGVKYGGCPLPQDTFSGKVVIEKQKVPFKIASHRLFVLFCRKNQNLCHKIHIIAFHFTRATSIKNPASNVYAIPTISPQRQIRI